METIQETIMSSKINCRGMRLIFRDTYLKRPPLNEVQAPLKSPALYLWLV